MARVWGEDRGGLTGHDVAGFPRDHHHAADHACVVDVAAADYAAVFAVEAGVVAFVFVGGGWVG